MNSIARSSPKVIIAYPDEGAHKRFHKTFKAEGYQEVICTKVRYWGIPTPLPFLFRYPIESDQSLLHAPMSTEPSAHHLTSPPLSTSL